MVSRQATVRIPMDSVDVKRHVYLLTYLLLDSQPLRLLFSPKVVVYGQSFDFAPRN